MILQANKKSGEGSSTRTSSCSCRRRLIEEAPTIEPRQYSAAIRAGRNLEFFKSCIVSRFFMIFQVVNFHESHIHDFSSIVTVPPLGVLLIFQGSCVSMDSPLGFLVLVVDNMFWRHGRQSNFHDNSFIMIVRPILCISS